MVAPFKAKNTIKRNFLNSAPDASSNVRLDLKSKQTNGQEKVFTWNLFSYLLSSLFLFCPIFPLLQPFCAPLQLGIFHCTYFHTTAVYNRNLTLKVYNKFIHLLRVFLLATATNNINNRCTQLNLVSRIIALLFLNGGFCYCCSLFLCWNMVVAVVAVDELTRCQHFVVVDFRV